MILVRHAQSAFNVVYSKTRVDPGIVDPELTPTGRRQAEELSRRLSGRAIARIVTSPYARALQTARIVAEALGLSITVEPIVRERHAFVCDIGTPRGALAARWPHLDFDHLDEQWWPSETESDESVLARGAAFRAIAAAWPDHANVLVVSHWGFVRALTGQSVQNGTTVRFDPAQAIGLVRRPGPC